MSGPGRIRVKICGMTRSADARCAAESGVDGLGFIFYAKSPRSVEPEAARAIIADLPPFVDAVGVFVDETLQRVAEIATTCRLDYVQLHGAESPDYCRRLAALIPCCRLLKAVRVGELTTVGDVAPYRDCIQAYLLDTYQKSAVGGTGLTFDWGLIERLQLGKPFLLAGGLDVGNIAVALASARPYGVDANSGLEDAPGHKNHDLIRRFIAAVRAFEAA